ncbi:MAG: EAL domain-containing protein [Myxococcota bacterium]
MLATLGRPAQIVTIDDDPLTHSLIKAILRSVNVQIHGARNGPDGIALVRAVLPDLVLLDYDMAGMNGLEVQRQLQADNSVRHIPVVFATGTDGTELLAACFAAGVADYVRKPLCAPELRARITSVLERRFMTERLEELAYHDPLTGLGNRRALKERIEAVLNRASPHASRSLMFMDVDRFKLVNDSLGHAFGDQLLCDIAVRVTNTLKTCTAKRGPSFEWFVGRLGGDEFAVLVEGLATATESEQIAARLLEGLSAPYLLGERRVYASASVGVVHLTENADPDMLVRDADTAMYEAKGSGRGRVVVFDPRMRDAVNLRLRLESDLRTALVENQFHLEYQPIIDLQTGRPCAVEALIRWNHPERGRVSPMTFISVAEETGLIIPIGSWVLDEACAAMARWQAQLKDDAPQSIHVNLSRKQLLLDDLVDVVRGAVERHGVPASCLHLEVTENELMQDPKGAARKMRDLRAFGVRIDMDDFGTGHSSLSCLQEFPLDLLKIDRSFLSNLGHQRSFAALLHAIATLAKNLDLQVVAEGIEEESQLAILQALDVDFGQGWLFSRSLPEEKLLDYFNSHRQPVTA